MQIYKVFDLHCDTMGLMFESEKVDIKINSAHIDLEKLAKGNSGVQCFALFDNKSKSNYQMNYLKSYIDFYHKTLAENPIFNPVKKTSDIKPDRLNAVLTMEDAGSMGGKCENMEYVYKQGVRMIALLWNYENAYGFPNSDNPEIMQTGLKPAGIEAVKMMNELKMIIDVSHMSYGCFFDVAKHSRSPFIASHSCADALTHHRRNLTDEMLKILADKGGVCGINFCSAFINGSETMTFAADIVRQAAHIKNVAGIEAVSIGSDFDGIENALEFKDFSGMPLVAKAFVDAGFTAAETEKIMYGNAQRVFTEVCG